MEKSYNNGDIWLPPNYPLTEPAEMGWALLFEASKRLLADYVPKYGKQIDALNEEDMMLEFLTNDGEGPKLIIGHGLELKKHGEPFMSFIPPELTSVAFQELSPQLRIHVARTMVWRYINDVLDSRESIEERWEKDENVHEMESAFGSDERTLWEEIQEEQEFQERDVPHDHPDHVAVANEIPELKTLFNGLLEGQIRYTE